MQRRSDVIMGKIIGGGLPAAAVGGRARADGAARAGRRGLPGGHAVGQPARGGRRASRRWRCWTSAAYVRLAAITERLADGLREAAARAGGRPCRSLSCPGLLTRLLQPSAPVRPRATSQALRPGGLRAPGAGSCSRAASTRRRRSSRRGSPRWRTRPSRSSARSTAAAAAFAELGDERRCERLRRAAARARAGLLRRAARRRRARRSAGDGSAGAPLAGRRSSRRRGPARSGPAQPSTSCCSRRSTRATCCTTARPACCDAPDADLGLLAGDRLYALGLARLVALGDLAAVGGARRRDHAHRAGPGRAASASWRERGLGGRRARGRAGAPSRAPPRGPRRWLAPRHAGRARGAARARIERATALSSVDILRAARAQDSIARTSRPASPSTPLDRRIPGAFEGETVTRRRFMTGTAHGAGARWRRPPSRCPRSASRSGPIFKSTPHRWETVGPTDMFPDNNYIPVVITLAPGHRRGRQDDGLRAQAQPGDRHRPVRPRHAATSRSRRAARTSAARCAGSTPPSASSAPATAASTTCSGVRVGGPPPRPLDRFYTRVQRRPGADRPRASASTASCARFSPRDPGEPLDGIGQYLYPSRPSTAAREQRCPGCRSSRAPPLPARCRRRRRARATSNGGRAAARAGARRPAITRRRLGRRAHLAERRRRAG